MIKFETEEDFEDAVMAVLAKRLEVSVNTSDAGYYSSDGKMIEVAINDNLGGCITNNSTSLPTPTLQY